MKLIYSLFLNYTGYSLSAQENLLSLKYTHPEIDIKCKFYNTGFIGVSKNRIQQFKAMEDPKNTEGRINIFHSVPQKFKRVTGATKNIGMCVFETLNLPKDWVVFMNEMDAILTASEFNKGIFKTHGVKVPIHVIPHCFDPLMFNKNIQSVGRYSKTTFLAIGSWKQRKNWPVLIKGFYEAFDAKDQVCLLIKTDHPEPLKKNVELIKNTTKWKSKDTAPIYADQTPVCTFEEIPQIMKRGDIYVNASLGEGFCTLPNKKVLTRFGYKNICDIKQNDMVYTHAGRYRKVLTTIDRFYSGDVVVMNVLQSFESQVLTPNHPVLAIPRKLCKGLKKGIDKNKLNHKNSEWIRASDLVKGDFLLLPINKTNTKLKNIDFSSYISDKNFIIKNDFIYYKKNNGRGSPIKVNALLTNHLLWLFGMYLSEGCSDHAGIYFTFHKKEYYFYNNVILLLKNIFGLDSSIFIIDNKAIVKVYSVILSNIFGNLFGKTSHYKHCDFIFDIDKEQLLSIFRGILDGDGHFDGKTIELQMVSKPLMEQLYAVLRQHGIAAGLRYSYRNHYRFRITSKYINEINWNKAKNNAKRSGPLSVKDNDYIYVPIKDIKIEKYSGIVHNLEIEEDNSYMLQTAVHNCLPGLHAMALGIPVITTRYSGSLEYAKPDLCMYFEPCKYERIPNMDGYPQFKNAIWPVITVEEIANKLRTAWKNYPQEKVEKAYNYVHENFSYSAIGHKFFGALS